MSISQQQGCPRANTFRLPVISLLYCGVWGVGTWWFFSLGQRGWGWGSLICFITGVMAVKQLLRAVDDWAMVGAHRRKKKQFEAGKKQHGQSRFTTEEDIIHSDILSDRQGIFLGDFPTGKGTFRSVFYDGPGSISAIAMPGQLKTMSLVVPSIIANPGQNLIINDPPGESYAICKSALEAMGFEVKVLTPFPDEVSERIGMKVEDVKLDVFSSFNPDMDPASIRPRLLQIMKWIIPSKPNNNDKKSEYFYRSARMLCGFLALKIMTENRKPTLPGIRKYLMEGPNYIGNLFVEAEGSTAFGGIYEELAKSLGGVLSSAPQQFAGGYGIAEQYLDPYDHFSLLGSHTSGEGFDPRSLKHPTKKTALFIISTLEMMQTIAPTTAMTLTYLFDSIAADKQSGSCTAIIDECGGLTMPLAESLAFYRKANLRLLMIWQDMAQAERHHSKTGFREILAASQLKIAMGISEPETLEMFSKLCGTKSVADMGVNDQSPLTDPMPMLSHGVNHRSVPLLRPEEIRTMDSNELLVVGGNMPPMRLKKVPYWTRPEWVKVTGKSPFYKG